MRRFTILYKANSSTFLTNFNKNDRLKVQSYIKRLGGSPTDISSLTREWPVGAAVITVTVLGR